MSADIPEAVKSLLAKLQEGGFVAVLVGGCVRDLLMGVHPKDYDVATSATPAEVQKLFRKVIPTGIQHGTVTVLLKGRSVEVTTFRAEGEYLDGRRPSSVRFGSDLADDLSRRDFTINAIAFDPIKNELFDPFNGRADLAARRVRCVGDAQLRFQEDGLRSLRAVRLATVLNFELDSQTREAIPKSLASFRKVSSERIRDEFCKILLSDRASLGIDLLRAVGLLEEFLPELLEGVGQEQDSRYVGDVYAHTLATVSLSPCDLTLRLAALLHDIAKRRTAVARVGGKGFDFPGHEKLGATVSEQILTRLKFPRKTIDEVAVLVAEHGGNWEEEWSAPKVRRLLAQIGENAVRQLLKLAQANHRARGRTGEEHPNAFRELEAQLDRVLAERPPLSPKELALDGNAIMRVLRVGPSPRVGEATRFLMDRVLEDPALNTEPALTEVLRTWAEFEGS